jgi:enoyl-CoA hydratase/carnithine racemase
MIASTSAKLQVEQRGHTALLTIDNPAANTWDTESLPALRDLVLALNAARDIYALVITGAGEKFFSAGADLKLFADGDPAAAGEMARLFGEAFETLADFRGVSIAAINGFAMGGGLEVAMACDIRIAERQAKLALPEARVGLLPCAGGTQRLARLVGEGWAKRMILCNERIDAATAERIGLVEEVVDAGTARARALDLAAQAAQQSPSAVARCKRLIHRRATGPSPRALPPSASCSSSCSRRRISARGLTPSSRSANRSGKMPEAAVLVRTEDAAGGRLGRLTLNSPKTLNSLTLEMVDLLQGALDAWRDDPEVAAIVIDGAGDRAFCAGGDVQALHASAVGTPGGPCEYAETFFAREYRMNYTLHTYPKPILCWGAGIVMGGGKGILAGCSQRVVCENTRMAMPEITIALFPDVGGSWFLNHMPGRSGRFLALTAAAINASDALFCGLADRFIAAASKDDVIDGLRALAWDHDTAANHQRLHHLLRDFSDATTVEAPAPQVLPHLQTINGLCDGDDIHDIIDRISAIDTQDRWLAKARDGLLHGSKLAALWIDRQLRETRHASLREVFRSELQLGTNIVRHPEFAEGVRALLIDKDRNPAWAYARSRDVPPEVLDGFFTAPWPENPLADL